MTASPPCLFARLSDGAASAVLPTPQNSVVTRSRLDCSPIGMQGRELSEHY